MPTNEQDVRALTYLAKRIRDDTRGAGRWDEAGIHAKVSELLGQNLAVTIERVCRHAADITAKTPGAVLRPFVPDAANPAAVRVPEPDPVDRCSVCSLHRDQCGMRWDGDHMFQPSHRKPTVEDTADRVQAMKAEAACHVRPPDPEKVPVEPSADVDRLREAKAAGPEPEQVEPEGATSV